MNKDQINENKRPRARDIGISIGELPPGELNAITDVNGVRVGHCTVSHGSGRLKRGRGPARTGVTAIFPHDNNTFLHKVPAAVYVINGFGKAVGTTQIEECGVLETPILLTNTLNVGKVTDVVVEFMLEQYSGIGVTTSTVNPVVFECNDGFLNDIQGRHVQKEHVYAALHGAKGGCVAEGSVGAGTGMSAFGWKGGIGTASRRVGHEDLASFTLGALVLSNFGNARDLIVDGWPFGRFLLPPDCKKEQRSGEEDGSVVVIIATDAPVTSRQLRRIATRATVGIVRCGSYLAHGSGDYVLAFSTATSLPHALESKDKNAQKTSGVINTQRTSVLLDNGIIMSQLFRAAGEATEEAVLNSMLRAHTMVGRDEHTRHALPVAPLVKWMSTYN